MKRFILLTLSAIGEGVVAVGGDGIKLSLVGGAGGFMIGCKRIGTTK